MEGLLAVGYLPVLSVLIVFVGILRFFLTKKNNSSRNRLLWLSLCLVLAILVLEIHSAITADPLSFPFAVGVKTMQAFSLDAGYDEIFAGIGGEQLHILLGAYKAILYTSAPIVGGTALYDIFAGISPYFDLFFQSWGHLCLFSQVNDATIALAESMVGETSWKKKPVLIFADADSAELTERLNQEGDAICLPDRLPDCRGLGRARECSFFLMDRDEQGIPDDERNLRSLRTLLNDETPCWPKKRGCHIFFLTNQASTVDSIRACKREYEKNRRTPGEGEVTIHVVRDHARRAAMLMEHLSIAETFPEKASGEPVRILVVGSGPLAQELFKTVFWYGQTAYHPLQIGVAYVPQEGAGDRNEWKDWLESCCPELLPSCTPEDESLRLTLTGSFGSPYASLCVVEENGDSLLSPSFLRKSRENQYGPLETPPFREYDYFLLATGNDTDNMALADSLWRELTYLGEERKTVAAAVEDKDLSAIYRLRCQAMEEGNRAVLVFPFGAAEESFHWETIFADERPLLNCKAEDLLHGLPDIPATMDQFYDDWSNLTRRLHFPVKMMTALEWSGPVKGNEELPKALREKLCFCERTAQDEALCQELAWLEHRRRNAFLRTEGFRRPPRLDQALLAAQEGTSLATEDLLHLAYKNVAARFHPALVECFREVHEGQKDLLDLVSQLRQEADRRAGKKAASDSLKDHDLPQEKYGPRLNREEVQLLLSRQGRQKVSPSLLKSWEDPDHPGWYFPGKVMGLS